MAIFYVEKNRSYLIGTIDFGENLNESNVGTQKSFPQFKNSFSGKCTIEIYSSEGEHIPHFHIEATDRSFSCCICIFDNRFFNHGKHKDVLARKDWKVLDEWMRKDNTKNKSMSNWEYIATTWDNIYGQDNYGNMTEQPDYTIIKPYKEK